MKIINLILIISSTVISTTNVWSQASQVGIIDFYGSNQESELRSCLTFKENDTLQFLTESAYPKSKKAIVDCLLSKSKIKQADIYFVCCAEKEGKWIVYVGVDSKSKKTLENSKKSDIKLSTEIKSNYDSLMDLLMIAIEKGEATENDSSGHSLLTYLPGRQLQEKFITYANQNLILLREVLKNSTYADQRRVAATVIAYYNNKAEIIKDLLGAVADSDEIVRNNAVRAIGIIANYSNRNPHLKIKIPADPFIDMINSITWTDRNKSSFVLLALTDSRDKQLLHQLKQEALKPIVEMAKWKSSGHSMPGYIILGRIAGWTDQAIMDGMNSDRGQIIQKMLDKINN